MIHFVLLPRITEDDECLLSERCDITMDTTIVVTNTINMPAIHSILHLDSDTARVGLVLFEYHS